MCPELVTDGEREVETEATEDAMTPVTTTTVAENDAGAEVGIEIATDGTPGGIAAAGDTAAN